MSYQQLRLDDDLRLPMVDPACLSDIENGLFTLTPKERTILFHLIDGQQTKEIAEVLGNSPRTIEVHRARIRTKLRCMSLTVLAFNLGFLEATMATTQFKRYL